MTDDPKATLKRYLQNTREALLWKLDGLGERDLRWPRTPTGTSLAGIVKHCANVEIGYFGSTFGRAWPAPEDPCYIPLEDYDDDPQADWYLGAEIPVAALVEFYRRVWTFADATIDTLPLEATGAPPWWGPAADNEVTLHHMLVRVADDLARHAGHADIIRESIDGAAGLNTTHPNLPDDYDWTGYLARITRIAQTFPEE